ncbi:ParB/RepB/Spo0J family partition protein [Woodsholea maritima]|uniref:ParB/RepB/Spo0J family partition protein n=1 Tax=Woodsholea maritima TaxID=240237 RepID=UPI000378A1AB|nr:ParB/RepB/Spo0J family partition protein [Woodsholea maritima]
MSVERSRGLGRGLSALLGEGADAEAMRDSMDHGEPSARTSEHSGAGVRVLPIDLLEANPDQPRRIFTESELEELAQSIADKGLLQPILVRPLPKDPSRYQIVAGERRWRASQRAHLHEVPCLIRELTDRETLEVAIVENVQRSDLNPVEEARAFRQLTERFGHTQEDVAKAVGKSRVHVANTLRLLALPDPVLDMLQAGKITAGHARAIASAPDPAALAVQVMEQGLSVRAAEALAREAINPKTPAVNGARSNSGGGGYKDADTRALEVDLAERLGLDIDIRHKGEAGEVRLRYTNLEQLDDICRRLSGPQGGAIEF